MAAFSSNGTKPSSRAKKGQMGGFFQNRGVQQRGFYWSEVDGDLLRMTLDACTEHGFGLAFFQASGGRGIKVRLYAEGPPSDEFVMSGAEMNGLLQWTLDNLKASDDRLKQLFEDVSTWLESRER